MAQREDLERQFQERIARAKEAARLASIAALNRAPSAPTTVPPPRAPPPHSLSSRGLPGLPPPPPPRPHVAITRPAVDAAAVPEPIRHRIDRLVEFIARNGPAFEETARARERDNPDFAFLHVGAPFHDYFQWRKSQQIQEGVLPSPPHGGPPQPAPGLPPHAGSSAPPPPRVLLAPNWTLPHSSPPADSVQILSVGAMANVCRAAKARGVPPYAPLPQEFFAQPASAVVVPPVEPARLDARLAEFYRSSVTS